MVEAKTDKSQQLPALLTFVYECLKPRGFKPDLKVIQQSLPIGFNLLNKWKFWYICHKNRLHSPPKNEK